MKTLCKVATLTLLLVVTAVGALAQDEARSHTTTVLANLTEGQGTVVGSTSDWEGWSELTLIPGGALFGVSTASTVITLGFSAGSTVNIQNMILYTTARSGSTITATKKVTLGGKSNPTISLSSTSVCPTQPVSLTNPCFVKLDAIKEALSPLNDYYFVEYFTSDSNNNSMRGAGASNFNNGLTGWQIDGDDTQIPVAGTIPVGYSGQAPIFTMYLTNE